jgi:hypothetical protein
MRKRKRKTKNNRQETRNEKALPPPPVCKRYYTRLWGRVVSHKVGWRTFTFAFGAVAGGWVAWCCCCCVVVVVVVVVVAADGIDDASCQ